MWRLVLGLVLPRPGRSLAPVQDDASGDERKAAEEEAVEPLQPAPLHQVGQPPPQVQNPADHGDPAEHAAQRGFGSLAHLDPSADPPGHSASAGGPPASYNAGRSGAY